MLTYFILGNIHVLRKHKEGVEGVSQMLTFAYVGVKGFAYVIIFWNFFALETMKNPKKLFKNDKKM